MTEAERWHFRRTRILAHGASSPDRVLWSLSEAANRVEGLARSVEHHLGGVSGRIWGGDTTLGAPGRQTEKRSARTLDAAPTDPARIPVLEALLGVSAILALVAALRYGYDLASYGTWLLGAGVLLAAVVVLEVVRRRGVSAAAAARRARAIDAGLVLGLLWSLEILVNNIAAPPLPGRDIFDDVIWAVVSLAIIGMAAVSARSTRSWRAAVVTGAWAGFASGLVACLTAVCVIVFGMSLLTRDPLNVAEWAARGAGAGTPDMASYFALQTFAGGLGHLLVLGLAMGAGLGALGGVIGLVASRRRRGPVQGEDERGGV